MKHILWTMSVVAVLCGIHLSVSSAQQPTAANDQKPTAAADPTAPEIAAIRAGSEAFTAAFNKGDAKAIAAMWTADAEYVDDTGRSYVGRDAIEQGYAEFFAANPNVQMQTVIDSLRLLSSETAMEDGRALVDPPPAGGPGVSKYTAVHVKVDGQWRMASVRDTWLETPPTRDSLADLGWLIGTWVAEEHGARSESVYRWVANESFIERTYTTTHVDGSETSGVQLIGWNPLQGRVQSWSFSPDGGHAIGVWLPNQDGWTGEMIGVAGDGTPTTSLTRLQRLDDSAIVWQSTQRSVGGIALPDTDEVVIKRQAAEPASKPTN